MSLPACRLIWPWLQAVAAAMICVSGDLAHAGEGTPRKPNIIFMMGDDLGYGDLGSYGQKTLKTPNIDRLAREGMRFTDFYAGSTVCAPSRCVLLTGLHTGHCYIRGNAEYGLRPEDVTLAEMLRDAGYATGLSGKWGLGEEGTAGVPTRQGFGHFFGYLNQQHAHNYFPAYLMRGETRLNLANVVPGTGDFGTGVAATRAEYSHDLIMQDALQFIAANKSGPFFLFLSYTIPHANNEAEERGMEIDDLGEFAESSWPPPERGFAAMLQRLDRDVGRLLDLLRTLGIDDDTIVFFTSDNGPHHEGGHSAEFFDSNGPLRGVKRTLYEGGIRVPMLVRWPGHVPAGATSNYPAYLADVFPTFAELAGAKSPRGLDGTSFLAAALGRTQKPGKPLYWEFYEDGFSQAARFGRWKAVRSGGKGKPIELYDLASDIGEKDNVAAAHPDLVEEAEAIFAKEHIPSAIWPMEAKDD